MSYGKSDKKPFEYASKISHRHIISDVEIQKYIQECKIPFEGKDVTLNQALIHDIKFPNNNRIQNIITVDGGYTTIPVKKKFPSALLTFFQFGCLLIKRKDLENLKSKPFISPTDMAKLKQLSPDKLALPTKNLLLKNQSSLKYAVRKAIYDFFCYKDNEDKPLIETLYWFLFKKYESNSVNSNNCDCEFERPAIEDYLHSCSKCGAKAYQLSQCPVCEKPIILEEKKLNKKTYNWQCTEAKCNGEIFLTDVFRLYEVVDEDLGATGILGYILSAIENLLLVHYIKYIYSSRVGFINEFLFIKDGPLSFVGQTANMYKPMRALLNYLAKTVNVNLIGIEKSGAFVDHAREISDKLKPGQVFLLNNDHVYKYIIPASGSMEYARTSYYSGKFIYKSKSEKLYVLTLPVETYNYYAQPELTDLKNIEEILMNIDLLNCDIYQDAIIPIALVNKLISLSNYPSANILKNFSKNNITE